MRGIRIFWICTKQTDNDGTDMKGTDDVTKGRQVLRKGDYLTAFPYFA